MFIGYYNIANLITLTGLISSVASCMLALSGRLQIAILLFMIAGLCDAFDGMVARRKKDRTEGEKVFGVQIDTVSDMVSFGVNPAMILYAMGKFRIFPLFDSLVSKGAVAAILIFYVVCGGIRLAYFNTLEITKTKEQENMPKTYVGMPIPFSAILFPLLFVLAEILPIPRGISATVLLVIYFITGVLFISNFKMKKLIGWVYFIYPAYTAILFILYIIFGGRLNAPGI